MISITPDIYISKTVFLCLPLSLLPLAGRENRAGGNILLGYSSSPSRNQEGKGKEQWTQRQTVRSSSIED